MPIGFTMPFAKTTSSLGYFAFSITDIEATLYNLKSLILTNWGERPNHFYMGGNLSEFLFAQSTQEMIDSIRQRITTQITTWLPYVDINSLDVSFFGVDNHGVKIIINFSIKGRQDLRSVLEVDVGGTGE